VGAGNLIPSALIPNINKITVSKTYSENLISLFIQKNVLVNIMVKKGLCWNESLTQSPDKIDH
jgi:hypothetical protein